MHKLEEIKHTEMYIVIIQTLQLMKECQLLILQQLDLVRAQQALLKSVANGLAGEDYGQEHCEIVLIIGIIGNVFIQTIIIMLFSKPLILALIQILKPEKSFTFTNNIVHTTSYQTANALPYFVWGGAILLLRRRRWQGPQSQKSVRRSWRKGQAGVPELYPCDGDQLYKRSELQR